MEIYEPYIPEDEPYEYESPAYEFETHLGKLVIDHLNSKIRLFDDERYNHVEITTDEQPPKLLAMRITQDFMDTLMEDNWRYEYTPFVDTSTQGWYERTVTSDEVDGVLYQIEIDHDIEELLGGES